MFFSNQPLYLLKKRWRLVFVGGIIVAIIALGISLLFPLQYRADAQVLVITNFSTGVDPYTAAKSSEQIATQIGQVIPTDVFYKKVHQQPGHNFNWAQFDSLNNRARRKMWQKDVRVSNVFGTGILTISTYNHNADQAKELDATIADTITTHGWEYVGGNVTMKVVNNPIVTQFPVRPNIALNIVIGFIIGILLTGLVVVRRL